MDNYNYSYYYIAAFLIIVFTTGIIVNTILFNKKLVYTSGIFKVFLLISGGISIIFSLMIFLLSFNKNSDIKTNTLSRALASGLTFLGVCILILIIMNLQAKFSDKHSNTEVIEYKRWKDK